MESRETPGKQSKHNNKDNKNKMKCGERAIRIKKKKKVRSHESPVVPFEFLWAAEFGISLKQGKANYACGFINLEEGNGNSVRVMKSNNKIG